MVGVAAQHRGFKLFWVCRQALLEKQADSAGQRLSAERGQILAQGKFPRSPRAKAASVCSSEVLPVPFRPRRPSWCRADFQFKLVDEPAPCHQDLQIAGLKKRHGDWVLNFQNQDERRYANQRGHYANRKLLRSEYCASEAVGEHQKAAAEQYAPGMR